MGSSSNSSSSSTPSPLSPGGEGGGEGNVFKDADDPCLYDTIAQFLVATDLNLNGGYRRVVPQAKSSHGPHEQGTTGSAHINQFGKLCPLTRKSKIIFLNGFVCLSVLTSFRF